MDDNSKTPDHPTAQPRLEVKKKPRASRKSPEKMSGAKRKLDFSSADDAHSSNKNNSNNCCSHNSNNTTDDDDTVRSGEVRPGSMDQAALESKSTEYNFDFQAGSPFSAEQLSELPGGQRYEWTVVEKK